MAHGLRLLAAYDGEDDDAELASLAIADALHMLIAFPEAMGEVAVAHLKGLCRALNGRVL